MAEDKVSPDSVGLRDDENCGIKAVKEDEVELARAEMSEVREENARLKLLLEKIEEDYKSLQMRLVDICHRPAEVEPEAQIHQECCSNPVMNGIDDHGTKDKDKNEEKHAVEEPELVSLCLGRSPKIMNKIPKDDDLKKKKEGDLRLGLDFDGGLEECKSDSMDLQSSDPSPQNSPSGKENKLGEEDDGDHHHEEEAARENWPPSKSFKAMRGGGEDDVSQATSLKRARVSVRVRCHTPTLNDGCQWRKYGQKIAKGNPCPRAYYRCTVAPSCPVRKQVQRCAEDMSILITTYEGTHNHPLPISATAMASTTSAAASMLLSGSSTSQPPTGLVSSSSSSSAAAASNSNSNYMNTAALLGLNVVNLPNNLSRTRPYYMPNSSPPSFPTITLDLTSDPPTSSPAPFSIFSTPRQQTSTSLSFSPSQPNATPSSSVWGGINNIGNLNYGSANAALPFGQTNSNHHIIMSSLNPGTTTTSQEHLHLPCLQKKNQLTPQQALTETLTKAITSDPSFRSVIAAAITTMVRSGGASASHAHNDSTTSTTKWDSAGKVVTNPLGPNGKGFMNHPSPSTPPRSLSFSMNQQAQPAAIFSVSAGPASAATSGNRDQTNRMV